MTIEDERVGALRQRYLENQVETATPQQRLLMLQHRLVQDMHAADEAFDPMAIETIHENLVHAQLIVLVLRDSLKGSDWSGAEALRAVYTFVHQRLVDCNMRKDRSLIALCVKLTQQILDANTRAAAAEAGQLEVVGAFQVA